ncbi:Methyltransferase domain-containing protein [Desulfotomaculum arcticum]|uniref:Methyltransferase domain-containing protein n=1 Tax=Desulfotruncus arcticus DSM 17038 TaxID=1121424 RepID=A0A1I2XDL8_9FIRM|nr:class I SAM-dependent methyltransferase [Desulfotruncus arcticus]SFH11610.1 Methyltransferase domain-containing protein [Desulfotomaculum arcticum] [Desulfotruncus arcticus DSM 17038]
MPIYDLNKLAASFDRIAPYFDVIRPIFITSYRKAVKITLGEFAAAGAAPRVLDIGTGTGTLAGAFAERGAVVTGVDISSGMLNRARKRYGSKITYLQGSALALAGFGDDSFDIAAAGFVLHEMPPDYRVKVLLEMKRLANRFVAVVDYVPNWNPVVTAVEKIEGSYYQQFLNEINGQLRDIFTSYHEVKLNHFMGLYLCRI